MKIEFKSPVAVLEFSEDIVTPRIVAPEPGGILVAVKQKGGDRIHLGIMLGRMNVGMGWNQSGDKVLVTAHVANPAIFVPALGQIVYGMESAWDHLLIETDLQFIDPDEAAPWKSALDAQFRAEEERLATATGSA